MHNKQARQLEGLGKKLLLATLTICFLLTAEVRAHDAGLSAFEIYLNDTGIVAELTFVPADIQQLTGADFDSENAKPQLEQLAREAVELHIDDRLATASEATAMFDQTSTAVRLRLVFKVQPRQRLLLNCHILSRLPAGHKQFLTLRDSDNQILLEQMLEHGKSDVYYDGLKPRTVRQQVPKFLLLGIEHILTGYDHLAFLLLILLAGTSLRDAVKVISSFTIAHSVSLALAALDFVRVSASAVEPLIAASIVYIGVENLWGRNFRFRWLIIFGFGLIHGLGFASVLRELNSGEVSREAIITLASFNVGVELGQIAMAVLVIPIFWKLRQYNAFHRMFAPACSIVVAIMGGYLLIERTFY